MDFLPEELEQYCLRHTSEESLLLQKINRYTHAHVLNPRMLSGHLQGRMLSFISHMIRPARILEIGTYTGYSALCLAEGLADLGKLITLDINEELEDIVRGFIAEANMEEKIDYRIGDANKLIPELEEEFDLVFIDADKSGYSGYYKAVFPKVRKGGYFLADNVLWSGKVTNENPDRDTRSLLDFNRMIQQDDRVENILLPLRDGLMLMRKK